MTAHILLIEDQVNLARFIELELKCEGYRVSVAHDGRTGLTLMQESAPNLVILDLVLPRLSGLEVCRHFRASGNPLPIIIITVKDEPAERIALLQAGAKGYIVKPFCMGDLIARVRTHLEMSATYSNKSHEYWQYLCQ